MQEKKSLGINLNGIVGPLAFGLPIFLSILASSYFLGTAPHADLGIKTVIDTISSKGILSGALELLGRVFSARFTLFTLLLPLTLSLIAILPFYYGRTRAYGISLGSCFLALLALIALSGLSKLGMISAVFFALGIVAVLETAYLKKDELKKFVTFRAVAASCKNGLLVISIGVLLTSAISAYMENDKNTAKIGEDLINVAFKQNAGQSGLTGKIADLVVQSQKQSISLISSTPQFEKLRGKTDPDVALYVAAVDKAKESLDSPEVKQKIAEEFNRQAQGSAGPEAGQQLITVDVLRKQSPIMDLMFRYYWVLIAFGIWTTFLAFSNIVLANLAGFYAALFRKAAELSGISGLLHD